MIGLLLLPQLDCILQTGNDHLHAHLKLAAMIQRALGQITGTASHMLTDDQALSAQGTPPLRLVRPKHNRCRQPYMCCHVG